MSTVTFDPHARPPKGEPVFRDERRPYEEYPRVLYTQDGAHVFVHSDAERADREAEGYAVSQQAARDAVARTQEVIANAAAERAWSDRRLSAKARAEKLAQERATDEHVPE